MGQQASTQQVASKQFNRPQQQNQLQNKTQHQHRVAYQYQYDGTIKFQTFPFNGSITIQSITGQTFYLQKFKTLSSLIRDQKSKSSQNYFTKDQIIILMQSVVYALADMENNQIAYKDVNLQNICIINKRAEFQVKLIPNDFIFKSSYERLVQFEESIQDKEFGFSPEMIIAYRCHQKSLVDVDIVHKSNIYSLGICLLQACTLKDFDCYDKQTLDIYQDEIQDCIQTIEKIYGNDISKIIANMLDYDYEQRMTPVQFAFWLNKELQNFEQIDQKQLCSQFIHKKQILAEKQQINQKILINESPQEKKIQIRKKIIRLTPEIQQQVLPNSYKFMKKYPNTNANTSSKRSIINPYINEAAIQKISQRTYAHSAFQQTNKQNKIGFVNNKNSLVRQNPYLQMRKSGSVCTSFDYTPNQSQQISKFSQDAQTSFRNQSMSFRNNFEHLRSSPSSRRQQKFALFEYHSRNQNNFERHQKLNFNNQEKSQGDGTSSSRRQIQRIRTEIQRSKKLILEFDSINKRKK